MIIIPAIDIKDGCVVRLFQGRFSDKKIYSKDPLKTAKHWVRQGAEVIHLVDLDGAETGIPKNINIVKQIAAELAVPVQFGGGVRKIETIKSLVDAGVWRVCLGTKAVEDSAFLKDALRKFPDKIIVSIDAKGGKVFIKGWQASSKTQDTLGFAKHLKDLGFKRMIYTDISKDGTLKGPNIKEIKSLLKNTGLKVIASGGVSSLEDIRKLKTLEKSGVEAVIVGKALYEGKFTLSQALKG